MKNRLKNYVNKIHSSTTRNYFHRMSDEKVKCMKIARKFDKYFFDGNRRFLQTSSLSDLFDGNFNPGTSGSVTDFLNKVLNYINFYILNNTFSIN